MTRDRVAENGFAGVSARNCESRSENGVAAGEERKAGETEDEDWKEDNRSPFSAVSEQTEATFASTPDSAGLLF